MKSDGSVQDLLPKLKNGWGVGEPNEKPHPQNCRVAPPPFRFVGVNGEKEKSPTRQPNAPVDLQELRA